MKVTLVAHYLDESIGHGMDRYSFKLMQGLRDKGIDVKPISSSTMFFGPAKSFFDFFFYLPLRSILPFNGSDIIHFTAFQAGIIIPLLKRLYRKKIVTTIYDLNLLLNPGDTVRTKSISRVAGDALTTAIKSSDLLLVISSQTKRDILEHFKIDEKKIHVTVLAADRKFQPIPKRNEIFTIGYLGYLAKTKNVQFLIRAYSIFEKRCKAPCRLLIYGKGPQFQEYVQLAQKLDVKNIKFCGFADEKEIVNIYNSFDVFVFPSIQEGFGLPIIEAQMCHIPVIVKEKAHVPEEVIKFCWKAKDEEHLSQLMEKIRTDGFTFSDEHIDYLKQFTWENCVEKTISAYKEVLGVK